MKAHKATLSELKGAAEQDQGPWGLIKSAAQVLLGGSTTKPEVDQVAIDKTRAEMRKIRHHIHAICKDRHKC
jgi:extracellular elastinolytic metalloproteinase